MTVQIDWSLVSTVINLIALGGAGVVGHYIKDMNAKIIDLKTADMALRAALEAADKETTRRVAQIELLIAGQYVTRGEFQSSIDKLTDALFRKLDAIEDKLDGKADKP